MNLQQNEAPAPRRYHRRRPLIRRHFHTSSELSHNQTTKHPPQRQHCGTRVVSQAALPSHVLVAQLVTLKTVLSLNLVLILGTVCNPMTLIQREQEVKEAKMDGSPTTEDSGKSLRPVRNRRYTRRSLVAGQRPQKRLFTPEIKRYLKDWLVRRRENPYPNREEKKYLSRETGLTYIQICNWFANWRRKLKNVNVDRNQQTWGHLIRTYNDRAQGNVEQFSICSDDSIWSEPAPSSDHEPLDIDTRLEGSPESSSEYQHLDTDFSSLSTDKCESFNNNSNEVDHRSIKTDDSKNITSPILLSKWLESAARFQPSETNYSWWAEGKRRKFESKPQLLTSKALRHDRDEVEAAVALTALASATSRLAAP